LVSFLFDWRRQTLLHLFEENNCRIRVNVVINIPNTANGLFPILYERQVLFGKSLKKQTEKTGSRRSVNLRKKVAAQQYQKFQPVI
jgi:hypothetical protein